MNKEEKLQKIREKIIEANPSILDLVFGCEVDVGRKNIPHYVVVISRMSSNKFTYDQHTNRKYEGIQEIIEYRDNFTIERTPIGEIFEIIGRPIIIDDVLITCNFDYKEWNADNHDKITNLLDIWQLGKPLSEQKPEVINFLYDILITNTK